MARKVYVFDKETQKMVEAEYYRRPAESKGPAVIEDTMQPALHPCTGEMIDSKRKFRAITRAHGCEEVGNERLDYYKQKPDLRKEKQARIEALSRAYEESQNGRR